MSAPRVLLCGGGTGGHLYPALNLAAAIRRAEPGTRILLVGARRGVEARVLPGREFEYRLLPVQPLWRQRPGRNWRTIVSAPVVAWGLAAIFRDFRPQLVVGTGGYAAAPALAWAMLRRIPTALQEQNAYPGLVTRWFAQRVDQLHVGYPEALRHLRPGPHTEVRTYGNPVASGPTRPSSGEVHRAGGSAFEWPEGRVVLVTGGSQGARALNEAMLTGLQAAADAWPADVSVVWVTGPEHFERIAAAIRTLDRADRVRVVEYIDDLGSHLHRVTLAISRAGAMSLSELTSAGVPAILVPLPAAAAGHQLANARALARAGAAEVREEGNELAGELWSLAVELLGDRARLSAMAAAARARGAPDAAARIAADLLRLAREGRGAARAEQWEGGRPASRSSGTEGAE